MISVPVLNRVAQELSDYRDLNGGRLLFFDGRDRGNYLGDLSEQIEMLFAADPTGFAVGMMLHEMIEATIEGTKVKLADVLRTDGFLDLVRKILTIKADLMAQLDAPLSNMLSRVNAALMVTSPAAGACSTRELAVCMRDAIHSLDRGLDMRWLRCDLKPSGGTGEGYALSLDIRQFESLAVFAEELITTMAFGAHLARIGEDFTAIGFKQPGRIAYLSTLKINEVRGNVIDGRSKDHLHAEALDLQTAVDRYPEWVTATSRQDGIGAEIIVSGRDSHQLDHLSKLPRNRLIWLAMVVEMAGQRLANVQPGDVELSELLVRALALPAAATTPASTALTLRQPNWVAPEIDLEATFEGLHFSPWEARYLLPALSGLTGEHFLPTGERPMTLLLDAKSLVPYHREDDEFLARQTRVRIDALSQQWVGTQAETLAVRATILRNNLARYLMAWGNRQFNADWTAALPWIKEQFIVAGAQAMNLGCVTFQQPNYYCPTPLRLYRQSPKHKGFRALCCIDGKSAVTHVAHFRPRNSADLVAMLGLEGESQLPGFLQGWARDCSWATTDLWDGVYREHAAQVNDRWDFIDEQQPIVEASIYFNAKNAPGLVGELHA